MRRLHLKIALAVVSVAFLGMGALSMALARHAYELKSQNQRLEQRVERLETEKAQLAMQQRQSTAVEVDRATFDPTMMLGPVGDAR